MSDISAGWVVWVTGLAGAGKTTISGEVTRLLRRRSPAVLRLDSDEFRTVTGATRDYDLASRLENARRLCRMAELVSLQGIHVVVATISLFHECHRWNRANFSRYLEVFLEVRHETLVQRNQKGLYSEGTRDVMGVHQVPELPKNPDLVIRNCDGAPSIEESAELIVSRLSAL